MKTIWGKVLLFSFLFTLGNSNLICSNSENLSQKDFVESLDSIDNETSTLKERLSDYKIVNPTRRTNLNLALISNVLFMNFDVNFKNSNGDTKKRKYHLEYYSYGTQFELAAKINFIVISEPELNFYNTNTEIELGIGIDIKTPLFDVVYIPFKNIPGNIKIFSIPITNYIIPAGFLLEDIDLDRNNEQIIKQNALNIFNFYRDLYKKNPIFLALPPFGVGTSIVTNGYLTPTELL